MINTPAPLADAALLACHECDLLQTAPAAAGQAVCCCRCGCQLLPRPGYPPATSLPLVLAGLLVFILANVFPVVGLEAGGVRTATTLLGTAWQLAQQQMQPVALLILLTGVLLPGLELLCLLYLLLPLSLGHAPPGFAMVMRLVRSLHPWGMVEVFLLGVLVALVKLAHMAAVHPGIGLWSFFALILLLAGSASRFDAGQLWERYQACRPSR